MGKFCQSCGMPLKSGENSQLGTNQDGSLSKEYCHYCFDDGEFTAPDMTLQEMTAVGIKGIEAGNGNFISKFLLKTFYPYQLKKLKRWQGQ